MNPKKRASLLMVLPMYVWVLLFVALPLLYVVGISFLKRDATWGVVAEPTLANYRTMLDPMYFRVFSDSLRTAFWTTCWTLLIGYPFGYCMARVSQRWRTLLLILVIVPFWTSALVRTYGWMILLRANGPVNTLLKALGIVEKPLKLLYTPAAVLLGMVYTLVPFMILPCYTAVERMDWKMVEAARDLGAPPWRAFLTVTLPLTLPGIISGCVLVFVPSVGLFFISDLMGGSKTVLLGNLIHEQLLRARNMPFGAALSVVLMVATAVVIGVQRKAGGRDIGIF